MSGSLSDQEYNMLSNIGNEYERVERKYYLSVSELNSSIRCEQQQKHHFDSSGIAMCDYADECKYTHGQLCMKCDGYDVSGNKTCTQCTYEFLSCDRPHYVDPIDNPDVVAYVKYICGKKTYYLLTHYKK